MILVKSPYRISLFGGGSDYPSFINKNGMGMCIGFAIDKYSYVSVRDLPPFFDYKTRLSYSQIETHKDNRHIGHRGIRETLWKMDMIDRPLEITHTSDLPTKTGLGTSSAFLVALSHGLYCLKHPDDKPFPTTIASLSSLIEQSYSNVGFQDHFFSALGGCGELCFHGDEKLGLHKINYIKYKQDILDIFSEGLLFFTGMERVSSDIVGEYIKDLPNNDAQKDIFDIATDISSSIARKKITFKKLGFALDETWYSKKCISSNISNDRIDNIYSKVMHGNGAVGGKLLGGGGGGCLFFLARKRYHQKIVEICHTEGCIHIPYKISQTGCERII